MNSTDWPSLDFKTWEKTCDTVHMWTQIVGKTRLALTPLENHWWNVALYITPRGLTTSCIPFASRSFEIQFDFISHRLAIQTDDGGERVVPLYARSVADFYGEYMASLKQLGIDVRIKRKPVEFDDVTPFDEDQHHDAYDKDYVERFRRVLNGADRVLKRFRSTFIGKSSPVHFFWGSFDLAVTRFSGQSNPQTANADPITREAYSHQVISCGWWPGDRRFPSPAFYAYAAPPPESFDKKNVRPSAAYWDKQLGEFILKYDDVRVLERPDAAILDFCQSVYEAGATSPDWNRKALERSA